MIWFIIGLFLGVIVGVSIMVLMAMASEKKK